MIDPGADLDVLVRAGWLSHVPAAFAQRVLGAGTLRRLEKGEYLYHLGDPPGGLYGLVSGAVGIAIASSHRGESFAHIGQPGFWCGEAAVLTGQPRRIGVWATRRTVTFHVPLAKLEALVEETPETWRWLGLLAVLNLDAALGCADDLMIRDPRRRCLAVLLRLAAHASTTNVEVNISQEDLASMANVSRTVASEMLREMQQHGWLEVTYRRLVLKDLAALHQEARGDHRGKAE